MHVRRLIVLSALGAAIVVAAPAAALAAAHGPGRGSKATDRPLKATHRPLEGRSIGINTINLATGAATNQSSGHLSHFGAVTGNGVQTITLTGPNTVSFTGSGVTIAANGDKLFATTSGTGRLTSKGVATATTLNTIAGGTGRFAGATGRFEVTSKSRPVSTVGSIETFDFTSTTEGQISY
jgi:hypothetical protein